jgi:hypothetical protein
MFRRIENGWALAVTSMRVLMLDKELLLFPLMSGIACLVVLATFVVPIWMSGMAERDGAAANGIAWLILFGYYFCNYFVIIFFNSALVACALIRLRGGDPTVSDGLHAAAERLPQIVSWAVLAATVGVVLRFLESRLKILGRIATAILGAAWTIATYFVVPVLVVEKLGPVDALKQSVKILKKTWGEAAVGNLGVGLITVLAFFFLFVPAVVVTVLLATRMQSVAVGLAGAAGCIVILLALALVGSALQSIVLSAVYLYATEQKVPEGFEGARLEEAFVTR